MDWIDHSRVQENIQIEPRDKIFSQSNWSSKAAHKRRRYGSRCSYVNGYLGDEWGPKCIWIGFIDLLWFSCRCGCKNIFSIFFCLFITLVRYQKLDSKDKTEYVWLECDEERECHSTRG